MSRKASLENVQFIDIFPKMLAAILVSATVATVVAIIVFRIAANHPADFADRWSGACTGWDRTNSLIHAVSDLVIWYVYLGIGITIALLHPRLYRIRNNLLTVGLISSVFISCGFTHLLDAVSTFHPIYGFSGYLRVLTAFVGVVGAFLVLHDLSVVSVIIKLGEEDLHEKQEKVNKCGRG